MGLFKGVLKLVDAAKRSHALDKKLTDEEMARIDSLMSQMPVHPETIDTFGHPWDLYGDSASRKRAMNPPVTRRRAINDINDAGNAVANGHPPYGITHDSMRGNARRIANEALMDSLFDEALKGKRRHIGHQSPPRRR